MERFAYYHFLQVTGLIHKGHLFESIEIKNERLLAKN